MKHLVKFYLDSFTWTCLKELAACLRHRQMTVPRSVRKFLYVKICLKHRLFVLIREMHTCTYIHVKLAMSAFLGASQRHVCFFLRVDRLISPFCCVDYCGDNIMYVGLNTRFSEKQMNLAAPCPSSHQASTSSCRSQRSNHTVFQGKASLVGQASSSQGFL